MEKNKGDFFFSTESADIAERRKADDEILASEEKYRAFFATSIDCVFITTLEGKWVDFNDAAIGLFGYDSREELMNVKIIDLYANPADRKDHIRNIREKGYSFEYPVNLRKKDGTIISTLITSVARKDREGNIIGFQGTVRDITEKKAAEDRISELLRIQDEQLRIINTSPAVAFLWRAEENWPVEMVSNNITQFGYSVDDFISGRVVYSTIIHPDDLERVSSEVEYNSSHKIDEFSQVYRIFGKDKTVYWIDDYTHIRRDTTGTITHYEGIVLDISDRRRAEEALKESEEKFRGVSERSSDLIMLTDEQGRITYIAPSVSRILGYDPDEFIGKAPGELVHPDDLHIIYEYLGQYAEGQGGETNFEARVRKKDKNYAILEFSGTPILKEGLYSGVQVVARDITQRRRTEEALNASEKRNRDRLETLLRLAEMESASKQELMDFVLDASCRLTESQFAFIGTMTPDETVFDIAAWSRTVMEDCSVAASPIRYPIEKAGIWAEAVRRREPFMVNDYQLPLPGKKGIPPGHVPIRRFVSIPIFEGHRIVMVAAVANKDTPYDKTDVNNLVLLMQGVWNHLRKRLAEEALRESEQKYRTLSEESPDQIFIIDRDDIVRYVNSTALRLLHLSLDQVIGKPRQILFPKEINVEQDISLKNVFESGKPLRQEGTIIFGDTTLSIDSNLVPLKDKDGTVTAVMGISRDITHLKRTEEALRESRQILEAILNSITVRVFWKDRNLVYLGCNTPFARDAGFENSGDIIGKDDYAMGWRDQAELYRADDRTVIESGTSKLLFEEPQTKPTGETIHLLTSKVPLRNANNEIIGVLGTYLDITDRKRAEEALKESEYRFRELFNSMSNGVAVYRAVDNGDDFIFVDFNHGAEIIDKKKKEEVFGKRVTDVFHGVREFGLLEVFQRVWRTGRSEHYPLTLYKDEQISGWRENFVYRLPSGEIVAIYDDVTDRRLAEEALKMSENRYRTLFEDSPISLWEEDFSDLKKWTDKKREEGIEDLPAYFEEHPEELMQCVQMVKVIHINRATMALFGAASFEEFRKGLSTIFSKESLDAFKDEMIALCNGEMVFEKEIPLRTVQGDRKMIIMKVTVVPGYEKTFSRIFVSGIDITERKSVEKALHQANKKLNMLSSITRHDILNLIMAIRGYLELSEDLVDNPELKEYMKRENDAVDSIQRQIEFTRYYQDIGVEEPKWQDAGEIVRKVTHQLNLSGITVDSRLSGLEIFADPLTEKVFYNLVENSLRHGEHVTTIGFSYKETGTGLTISYQDDGVGITEADKKKLFQKGFGKHTGLGLFLSREILSITGITIRENGEPGNGVNFEIIVPEDGYRVKDTT